MSRFARVDQVVASGLCLGCGACMPVCPTGSISIVDDVRRQSGLRPRVNDDSCEGCGYCAQVCPAIEIKREKSTAAVIPGLEQAWGPVLGVWEGFAVDPVVRFRGSSGGAATAIGAFALEVLGAKSVFHIRQDEDNPTRNRAAISTTRADLLEAAGSRYSPAALCLQIDQLLCLPGPAVIVGKPCDIVAFNKLKKFRSGLDDKVMVTIAIFCAGTPSTTGTLDILADLDCREKDLRSIRYRGNGWPGDTTVELQHGPGDVEVRTLPYRRAWSGILTHHVQPRCRLCPDSTGEFADISVGDPWHRDPPNDRNGFSLVLTRTAAGRRVIDQAMRSNYLRLWPAAPSVLPASQRSLQKRRRELFGRLLARRIMGLATPRFEGFSLIANWRELPLKVRLRALADQLRRLKGRRDRHGWRPLRNLSRSVSTRMPGP